MKTFVRLIRRYVLAAVSIVVLLLFLGIGLIAWLGWREGQRLPRQTYDSTVIADAMIKTEDTLMFGAEHTPEEWMDGYAWAMVLDDQGHIIWNYALPEELHKTYTASDIASFSRWYLRDYPVFCHVTDYGLFVIGLPKGSLWRYNLYNSPDGLRDLVHSIFFILPGSLLLGLAFCFWLGWRGTRQLQTVAAGLDTLAQGKTVQLPTSGFTGELAEKLNRTSSHLQQKNEMLARRDDTRTQWIAGVSHDVRTPLALILGWSEQLEQNAALPDTARQKAAGIRTQSEKLRSLIDDLNLTSKLEYGAQPLRKERFTAGPLFRELVAQLYDSPLAEKCEISLHQSDAAEHAQILVDRALLGRLLENLISNSVRHYKTLGDDEGRQDISPDDNRQSNAYSAITPVKISIQIDVVKEMLHLTVTDNGQGYPETVLAALSFGGTGENTPHILGLHVVEQIAAAHGGKATFGQNTPCGAKAVVELPTESI